jgi:hypothetical protein
MRARVHVCVPDSDVTPVDYEGAKALTLGEWGMPASDRCQIYWILDVLLGSQWMGVTDAGVLGVKLCV